MKKNKQEYINFLEEVSSLLSLFSIQTKKQKELIQKIENIELLVPVVGGFSAGKSTLINSFLGEELLSVNLTPETALATEIRYSSQNYIEAIKDNDEAERFEIDDSEMIKNNASKYKYLKLFFNNEKLKAIEPLVLVDMPGFDSPLELHNQAILNYLSKGIYFIVLTSIEDGNLTKSTIRELENMTEFGKDFSFCLSKIDLKGKSDVISVQEKIQNQLREYFDFEKDVLAVSKDSGQVLDKILKDINTEELFEKIFKDDLKYIYFDSQSTFNTMASTLKSSKEEIIEAIRDLKQSIEKINLKKQNMINEAKSKYSDNSVDAIIESISKELNFNKENLATTAMINTDLFSREINEIVKNTLIFEVRRKMDDISDDIINNFSIEIKDVTRDLSEFDLGEKWVDTISESTKTFLQNTQNGLNDFISDREKISNKKSGTIYKMITAVLGLTTSVINPILEIVIVFLPEIVSFFTGKLQDSKRKESIVIKLSSEVIPSIKTKIRGELPILFQNQINNLIELICNRFEDELKEKEQHIIKVQNEKENTIKDMESEILKLNNAKDTLQKLATKTIYKG